MPKGYPKGREGATPLQLKIAEMLQQGIKHKIIAQEAGSSLNYIAEVHRWVKYGMVGSVTDAKCHYIRLRDWKQNERVWRSCLKCDGRFKAYGRFNRLCPGCTTRFSEYYVFQ